MHLVIYRELTESKSLYEQITNKFDNFVAQNF